MLGLKELKELCEKATPPPWKRHPNKRFWALLPGPEEHEYLEVEHDANAEFCAAAREALPRLVEIVERCLPWLLALKDFSDMDVIDLPSYAIDDDGKLPEWNDTKDGLQELIEIIEGGK